MLKEVSIEIIRKCPNHCLHCSSLSNDQCKEIMPFNKFKEVVTDAKKLGAETICLSGGEPFLHSEIIEFVSFVRTSGLNCYIYTSGVTLDGDGLAVPISLDEMKRLSCLVTKIIFNIEAGTEETYNKIMGTNGHFKLMQQSALNADKAGIRTEAHFVPMALNVSEIDAVINLCRAIHISKISFLRLVIHGRASQHRELLELSDKSLLQFKDKLFSIQARADFPIRIGVPLTEDMTCAKCEAANGKLNIKYDGAVYPCEVFKNIRMEHSLEGILPENIYDHSLEEIYTDSEFLKRVRSISSDFVASGHCETCVGQFMIKKETET